MPQLNKRHFDMFLIRSAFWLTLIILLLPTNEQDQKNVFGIAKSTFGDIQSFCDRNRETCDQGKSVISKFAEKAEFGADLLINIVRGENRLEDQSAARSIQGSAWLQPNSKGALKSPQNTLNREDFTPPWSFPDAKSGI